MCIRDSATSLFGEITLIFGVIGRHGACAAKCRVKPVSYTHLDVYKRQKQTQCEDVAKLLGISIEHTVKAIALVANEDVYKRQHRYR